MLVHTGSERPIVGQWTLPFTSPEVCRGQGFGTALYTGAV